MSKIKREIPIFNLPIIETHFHLDMLKAMTREEVVAKALLHNIVKMITISTSPNNLDEVISIAEKFSNNPDSHKSSLGFYITGDTYNGEHGFSLHLEGEEKGINDNAYSRDIVMHSAAYVNENYIKAKGYIGRSLGCPALPKKVYKPIINEIKNGTCLFLYSPNTYYLSHSTFLQPAS